MTKYEDGLYEISNAEYHASDAVSRSNLMDFKKSPYHYWYAKHNDDMPEEEDSKNLLIGNLVHTLVLEPHKFNDEFHLITQKQRPARGTKPHETMIEEAAGRNIITANDLKLAESICNAVVKNETCVNLLTGCKIEQSIFWTHESGIQCKARPDAWRDNIVIDLKTTADASFKAFQYSFLNYGYYLQSAILKRALSSLNCELSQFVIICVEKKPPYAVGIYILDAAALERGEQEFDDMMFKLAQCYEKNEWPCYETQFMSLPDWYISKESI